MLEGGEATMQHEAEKFDSETGALNKSLDLAAGDALGLLGFQYVRIGAVETTKVDEKEEKMKDCVWVGEETGLREMAEHILKAHRIIGVDLEYYGFAKVRVEDHNTG